MTVPQHIPARTYHGRDAEGVRNAFAYGIDYVLLEPEADTPLPRLFARNGRGFAALNDADHGGPPGDGRGTAWVRDVLEAQEIDCADGRILLLAQPRVLGHVFNPVSFWLCHDRDDVLRVVIAEVTNTFGDRHSYLCHSPNFAPIQREMVLEATKIFHVSPFQPVEGRYRFRFDIRPDEIGIWIEYRSENGRLIATLAGPRRPLTSWGLLGAALRRPFGSRRVLGLIHWQALKLWWKGAAYRPRPAPPETEVSR
ncbi:DUF1365 domain-containing protein [Jannaschia seohaensis]|uniref:Cyclopropane-fatty-acyl-phospholipid synthase n=1 Tax=Jannaschia seohaensis TaxID=475081 RepID=A0A2Y9B3H4_9RHOB|nr:DUF1365 domain-containing protein [Jannaschia seohaensis]PWJ12510.1 hypothetical protein BCF38_11668 [Jannaschia seohaensis]SSA50991.1 hypothetical protein SAMN05421539_11668 [Jannaschia seohaensis]